MGVVGGQIADWQGAQVVDGHALIEAAWADASLVVIEPLRVGVDGALEFKKIINTRISVCIRSILWQTPYFWEI